MVIRAVVLDAGPLGLVTNPNRSTLSKDCLRWMQSLLAAGIRVIVPEIADYEIRRELVRANKQRGIARLNELITLVDYLPISTAAMRRAADLWAQVRRSGRPTAADQALDADVILGAQALTCGEVDFVIATTNVGHLSRFAPAEIWPKIVPS